MKKDIHPTYHKAKVVCTSCGAEFETGSVLSEIKVDTCSKLPSILYWTSEIRTGSRTYREVQ